MKPSWKRRGIALIAAVAAATATAPVASPTARAEPAGLSVGNDKAMYVVQMLDMPVVAYDGSVKGLAATKPKAGQKVDPTSAKVTKYAAFLDQSHSAALSKVGGRKIYDYRYSFNGFAAELTATAAMKLQGMPGVVAVSKNEMLSLDTADTPDFLGLSGEGGVWDQLGGPIGGKSIDGAGEGVIIGVVDSGVWPESASFSDRNAKGKRVYQQIAGWHGKCVPGEAFAASMCNQKLIGAQYFNEGFGGSAGVDASFPDAYEFNSVRDADGHGTHTASTAGGNYGVETNTVLAGTMLGPISGMAPRARIAAYKACWGISPDGGCTTVDTVAAIDQAVADGVDVINYSISGSQNVFLDPVEVAFLFAADAGVFVAASAGNDGPDAETLNHPSPWLTTVAASTHSRVAIASGSLGDGTTLSGVGVADTTVSSGLVYAGDIPADGVDGDTAALCYEGSLDEDLAAGKIVACDRGAIARVDKSAAVLQAGGVGMFLMNVSPSTLNADNHLVPTLHVDELARATILTYVAGEGTPTGTINAAMITFDGEPEMAAFSSRGPISGGDFDVLKPDITAPGVDVLAAVSPYSSGRDFDFLSGTSMSSPHMAGIGALMTDAHPNWTPMMIKSALMTTAYQAVTDAGAPADAFDFGAGHVNPPNALDPGLVYDAGWTDWLGFLCGTGELEAPYCATIGIDPSDLNQPSIAIGALAGVQTITRRVTNVGATGTYAVSVDGLDGVSVSVSPDVLTLAPGQTASYTVTFTTNGAPLDVYAEGSLEWSDGSHSVRSPIVVRPVAIAAPSEVSSTGGNITYEVGFGTGGAFSATPVGLVPAEQIEGNVVDDPANDIATAIGSGVGYTLHTVVIPAGSTMARFSLFDDYTDGNDDLDLYIFDAGFNPVGGSGSGTSAEQVDIDIEVSPIGATTFHVLVHGWQTDGADANYTLFAWGLPPTASGNMAVAAPVVAVVGGTGTIDLEIGLLAADEKYIGAVNYVVGVTPVGQTIVRVDTD